MLSPILVVAALVASSLGNVYESVADLTGSLTYDFVIIGGSKLGGTAGLVVANRLTENPNFSVLVLEAGVSNIGVLDSTIPLFAVNFLEQTIYDWNYTTTPQSGVNNRVLDYLRARMLGGCSSHNGMVYSRGTVEDWNRYANVTHDPSWSWNNVLPYFFKNEKWSPPADHHDTLGQFDPSVHSTHGITSVSLGGFQWRTFNKHVIQTTKELPDVFPFDLDMNSGQPLGVGWVQSTIGDGMRSSSATSYLAENFAQRKNLDVLLHAQVSDLVDASHANGKLSFSGVRFSQGTSQFTAKAQKEIILSAGAVGTPNVLMHSGIGDQNILGSVGVPTVLHLPSVGRNVSDQPFFLASWSVNFNETIDSVTQNATRFNEAFAQWNKTHTGPFTNYLITHVAWLRLDPDSSIFDNQTDPAAGPHSPHIELFLAPGGGGEPGHFVSAGIYVLNPKSRGSITINTNNPFDPPVIDLGLLQNDLDIFTLREGIKRANQFYSAPTWQDSIIGPTQDLENVTTAALDEIIRNSAGVGLHMVGSAAMSPRDATWGVVNPDLLVKGIDGLRIVDASVLPFVPSAHTQAATYVVAERGADLIKQRWN
ncbi:pyranose dehydrogenase [Mycena rosella]|uniref:Pyranose dehydrogenase n=1 Tax=Mycena rosella TaxID=1033263 RepID=A0AAD7DKS7_MYCRO|nr:pyranose dehydrogenase [Mycena rosella]